ncbi:CpaD family pilus assembly protein [Aminobacter sp. AP02]|uniref:CpaD family pilus assembly protein n=1 Tax=Aminobacter sp. AP02 TaxID=2135737 RepID=UPI000D6BACCB|nr:CpaD family pilus assembly protein [Aminobacter sp. AP02]PWK68381.1 pilus assembly protein CpaD [Aminobacter sp. AP02]
MSQAILTRNPDRSAKARMFGPLLAAAAVVLLAGCANRDSITVGSIPDDYRTNHPIVIAEKNQTIDIPVGAGDRGITRSQQITFEGFLQNYDRRAAPTLTIMAPSGGANDVAASKAARGLMNVAIKAGVPKNRIAITNYQSDYAEASSPLRIVYSAMRAQTDRCGRWPDDVLNNVDNKHYANFGCSYQNNVAAQIANPADLLGPRKQTPIDAENRDVVIGEYRTAPRTWRPETTY